MSPGFNRAGFGHTRRVRPIVVTTVVAAALLLVAGASSATRPSVRVASRQPLTIVGRGFQPNERVTVTAIANGRHVTTVRATAAGRFRVRFRHVRVKRCLAFIVSARGSLASFAILNIRCACAAP